MLRKTKNDGICEIVEKKENSANDILKCLICEKNVPRNAFSKHKKSKFHLEQTNNYLVGGVLSQDNNLVNNNLVNNNLVGGNLKQETNLKQNNNLDTNTILKELENIKKDYQQLKTNYNNLNSKYNDLEKRQLGGNNNNNLEKEINKEVSHIKSDIKNISSLTKLMFEELDNLKNKQLGGNINKDVLNEIYYSLKKKLYEKLKYQAGGYNKQFENLNLELQELKNTFNHKNIFSSQKSNTPNNNKYRNNLDTLAEITELEKF